MHEWTKNIDTYLRGLIILEGRGHVGTSCFQCHIPEHEAKFRCLCCDDLGLICQDCMLSTHQFLPFHRIQV
jgi:hypothetical protein